MMELADVTVHPSTSLHYHNNTLPSTSTDNLDAFQRELHDRSFDVGDDEEEEEQSQQDNDDPTMNNDGVHPLIAELREIGMFHFIEKYVPAPGNTSSTALEWNTLLKAFGITLPDMPEDAEPISDAQLLRVLKVAISRALRARISLSQYTTPSDAVSLIHRSSNILILTGAGISTNCGIPDFRSKDTGLYSTLLKSGKYSDFLSDPQEMFDISVFKEFPNLFYDFAKEIYTYPEQATEGEEEKEGRKSKIKCSKTHKWIRKLEMWNDGPHASESSDKEPKQEIEEGAGSGSKGKGKLLRCYTQNIDTLEQTAGIQNVLYAHGSFATCSCLTCGTCFPGDTIKDAIQNQTVPLCPLCPCAPPSSRPSKRRKLDLHSNGHLRPSPSPSSDDENDYGFSPYHGLPLLKPDITFFGQALSSSFDTTLLSDRSKVDLLIIIGTSLQVAPVSEILAHLPHSVPQILINRDPVPHVMDKVDIVLLGDCDEVVGWLDNELEKLRAKEGERKEDERNDGYDGPEPVLALPARPIPIPSHSLPPHPHLSSGTTATTTPESGISYTQEPQEQQETVLSDSVENIWLFKGANTEHRWLRLAREALDHVDSDDAEEDDEAEDEQSSEDEREEGDGRGNEVETVADGSHLAVG